MTGGQSSCAHQEARTLSADRHVSLDVRTSSADAESAVDPPSAAAAGGGAAGGAGIAEPRHCCGAAAGAGGAGLILC